MALCITIAVHYPHWRIWRSGDRASWYILIIKPRRSTNFWNLFCSRTLRVSDSFSVHHQESSTAHTHTHTHTAICICHTGYAHCFLAGSEWNSSVVIICCQVMIGWYASCFARRWRTPDVFCIVVRSVFCFLTYINFSSWFRRWWVAGFVVFWYCEFLPFILMDI